MYGRKRLKKYKSERGSTTVKTYTVYRIDFLNKKKVPIGMLVERREKERNKNEVDIMRLAQRLFAESSIDKRRITVSPE